MQVVPLQQLVPLQEVLSQTQVPGPPEPFPVGPSITVPPPAPDWHSCPETHSAPFPHRHMPPEQLFASVASQLMHCTPPVPQSLSVLPATQRFVLLSQQPGHVLSQRQVPASQYSPALHGPPLIPHVQFPVASHLSLLVVLHMTHGPPLPHCGNVDAMQLVPLQHHPAMHPPLQPVHTPAVHVPGKQLAHVPPLLPQTPFMLPG
jgi:hypothetical protein